MSIIAFELDYKNLSKKKQVAALSLFIEQLVKLEDPAITEVCVVYSAWFKKAVF